MYYECKKEFEEIEKRFLQLEKRIEKYRKDKVK